MAIRNTKLGGTSNFLTPSDRIKPTDLNDTFGVLGDVVEKALGSLFNDVAQNLFNHAYLGFDSRLNDEGAPLLDKVIYSILTSDSAVSKTNFTYDATYDLYSLDDGSSAAELIFGLNSDVGENITNIIPILNSLEFFSYSDETGIVTNADFETGDQTGWSHSSSENNDFSRISTDPYEGTYSWEMGTTTDGYTSTSQTLSQTVDLTGVAKVTCRIKRATSNSDNGNYSAGLVVGSASDIRSGSVMTGGWDLFEVIVPEANRTTGQTIQLKHNMGNPSSCGNTMRYDDIRTIGNQTEIELDLSLSNDGSNYEAVTNKKLHRPSTTGQKALLKVTPSLTGSEEYIEGKVTEFAMKYNSY